MKIYIKKIIEALYWLYKFYITNDEAFDEIVKDPRDYESLAWWETKGLPQRFEYKPYLVTDQRKDWYRMSCTSQWTAGAINTSTKYKKGKTFYLPEPLWDDMVDNKVGDRKRGAYLKDAVGTAYKKGWFKAYYRATSNDAKKEALYRGDLIVTGSTKIDWKELIKTDNIVRAAWQGYWHAFYIVGWNEIWWICQNSYWPDFVLNQFVIPYSLADEVLFNSTYALTVNDPDWTKISKGELFEKYKLTRMKNANK